MTFQDLILKLHDFWGAFGCLLAFNTFPSTGTFNPASFFGVLGKKPWRIAYVHLQPSRRPIEGRYSDNPFRLYLRHQYQVILKPPPADFQDIYLKSLAGLNIELKQHDIRFKAHNWNLSTLGGWGKGWQVLLDGMAIAQLTYLQKMGGLALEPIAGAITYDLEWICFLIQGVEDFFQLAWNESYKYSQLRGEEEHQFSVYHSAVADIAGINKVLELSEIEAQRCLANNLFLSAYDYVLKCAHLLDILIARRAISPAEQQRFIKLVQNLAGECAKQYLNLSS